MTRRDGCGLQRAEGTEDRLGSVRGCLGPGPCGWTAPPTPLPAHPHEGVETDGHPVGEQLLHHRLCPGMTGAGGLQGSLPCRPQAPGGPPSTAARPPRLPAPHRPAQHQLRVPGHVLGHQVAEQRAEDVGEVLQLPVQRHREQRRHVGAVPRGEGALALQGVDELAAAEGWVGGRDRSETQGCRGGRGAGQGCTLVRKSLLLSRLQSWPSPCSTVARRLSGTPRSLCRGDSWCPGKKMRSAYTL